MIFFFIIREIETDQLEKTLFFPEIQFENFLQFFSQIKTWYLEVFGKKLVA